MKAIRACQHRRSLSATWLIIFAKDTLIFAHDTHSSSPRTTCRQILARPVSAYKYGGLLFCKSLHCRNFNGLPGNSVLHVKSGIFKSIIRRSLPEFSVLKSVDLSICDRKIWNLSNVLLQNLPAEEGKSQSFCHIILTYCRRMSGCPWLFICWPMHDIVFLT